MEEHEIKIESGIPMPRQNRRGAGYWQGIIREMEVGDSVLIPEDRVSKRTAIVYSGCWNRRFKPMRFSGRTIEGGVRIWRIE